jgi:hypothetical protein
LRLSIAGGRGLGFDLADGVGAGFRAVSVTATVLASAHRRLAGPRPRGRGGGVGQLRLQAGVGLAGGGQRQWRRPLRRGSAGLAQRGLEVCGGTAGSCGAACRAAASALALSVRSARRHSAARRRQGGIGANSGGALVAR